MVLMPLLDMRTYICSHRYLTLLHQWRTIFVF